MINMSIKYQGNKVFKVCLTLNKDELSSPLGEFIADSVTIEDRDIDSGLIDIIKTDED